jgi:hypothetical protein
MKRMRVVDDEPELLDIQQGAVSDIPKPFNLIYMDHPQDSV